MDPELVGEGLCPREERIGDNTSDGVKRRPRIDDKILDNVTLGCNGVQEEHELGRVHGGARRIRLLVWSWDGVKPNVGDVRVRIIIISWFGWSGVEVDSLLCFGCVNEGDDDTSKGQVCGEA